MSAKMAGLERVYANKASVPQSAVPGQNTKTLGRVAPVEPVKQNVVKTAAEKATISRASVEKTAAEKTASMSVKDIAATHAVGALAGVAAAHFGNAAINKINGLIAAPKYKRSLDKALTINPRLQQYPRTKLEEYLELIIEASPSVAGNPLLLSNYLEYLIDHQGQLNYTSYNSLVNLESQIISNRNNANPLSGAVQKAIVENTIRGAFDSKRKLDEIDLTDKIKGKYESQMGHMRDQHDIDVQRARRAGMDFAYESMYQNP